MFTQLFHHPEDRLPTAIIFIFFLVQLSAYFLVESLWAAIPLALLFLTLGSMSIAVSHNHCHCETFKSPLINRIYEVSLYLQSGVSPYAWILHHVVGHHRHYLDQKIDPSPWQREDGETMGRWEYMLINARDMYPNLLKIAEHYPDLKKNFWIMFIISNAVLALLIAYNPVNAFIFFIGPMIFMVLNLMDATYPHHSGLYSQDEYSASRNNMDWLFNLFTWNLGYHTAHHMWPEMHWSLLPAKHEEIKDKIPAELILNNYFWKANDA